MTPRLPPNFERLYTHENGLREQAVTLIAADARLQSHVRMVERAMVIADRLSRLPDPDADLKLVQALAVRTFNAFAAALRLALSGYARDSALILRDILEMVFLLDLFAGDRSTIEPCRSAEPQTRMAQFSPLELQRQLDERDGAGGARKKLHDRYSELSGQSGGQSALTAYGDTTLGPRVDRSSLDAVLFELARVAEQAGGPLNRFFPYGSDAQLAFEKEKLDRIQKFHSVPMPSAPKAR